MRRILGKIALLLSLGLTPVAAPQDVAAQQPPQAPVGALRGGTSIVAFPSSTIRTDKLKVGDVLQLHVVDVYQPCAENPLPRGGTLQIRVSFVKESTHEDPGASLGLVAERIVWPNGALPLRALLAAAWNTGSVTPRVTSTSGIGGGGMGGLSPEARHATIYDPCAGSIRTGCSAGASPLNKPGPVYYDPAPSTRSSYTWGPSPNSDWKVVDAADPAVGRILVSENKNIKLEEGSYIRFIVQREGSSAGPAAQVPNGTRLPGQLTSAVDAASGHVGDQVTFILSSWVCVGEVAIPSGAKLLAHITEVHPYKEGDTSRLSLILERAEWEGGSVPLHAFVAKLLVQDPNLAADPALGSILVSRTNNVHLPAGALVIFKQWKTE